MRVVTLSTQDNAKLSQQLKWAFNRTINWNKYEPNISPKRQNQYLNFLIGPSFQVLNRLFVLSFENENDRTVHTKYYLPTVEIKDYNVMIDAKNFFDQSVKSSVKTYDNIRKPATGQGDDYTTGCLLDYNSFNNYYKMIAIDLSKQQAFDADLKAIQKICWKSRSSSRWNNVFHYWRTKRNHFRFFTRNCESIVNLFINFILFYNYINIKWLNITL